ncbi:SAV1978 family virulence-associated passenger protein [Mammaliicoccus sciuri]|uniref:SAV1978 family virulence-associated passenger protein n=1 Tax=Mammaliicoccus sciuri TaxID=1296 RepID=UPI0039E18476
MRTEYFRNKYYLVKDNQRIAHVHIVDGTYKVCGHYKKFKEFKHRVFNKETFEQFCRDRHISIGSEDMGLLDKYDLYNSEGKKMFTVIPGKETNTLLGMPHTPFVRQEHKLTDSELRQFKAAHDLKLEEELGLQLDIWDVI